MKNLLKFGCFAIISFLLATACNSNAAGGRNSDSTDVDTTAIGPLDADAAVDPTTGCD